MLPPIKFNLKNKEKSQRREVSSRSKELCKRQRGFETVEGPRHPREGLPSSPARPRGSARRVLASSWGTEVGSYPSPGFYLLSLGASPTRRLNADVLGGMTALFQARSGDGSWGPGDASGSFCGKKTTHTALQVGHPRAQSRRHGPSFGAQVSAETGGRQLPRQTESDLGEGCRLGPEEKYFPADFTAHTSPTSRRRWRCSYEIKIGSSMQGVPPKTCTDDVCRVYYTLKT